MKKAIVVLSAALMLLAGACGVLPDYSSDMDNEQSPGINVQTQQPEGSIEDAVAGEKLIYGDSNAEEEPEPQQGEAVLTQSVHNSVSSLGNKDAYFYVRLEACFYLDKDFEFEGRQYKEWDKVPEMQAYYDAYDVWLQDVYPGLDAQMKAAQARGEEQAKGWDNHNPQDYFDIYYEHTQTQEVITAWKDARDKANAAQQAYEDWTKSDEYLEQLYSLLKSETLRLKEEGLFVELRGWDIVGYLTKEQVRDFDCGEYGYAIGWGEKPAE